MENGIKNEKNRKPNLIYTRMGKESILNFIDLL